MRRVKIMTQLTKLRSVAPTIINKKEPDNPALFILTISETMSGV